MSFRRTSAGLSNLHRFAGVDLVVFTEGGARTIAKAEALRGRSEKPGMDTYFWGELFRRARPDIKVSVRCLGSKKVLVDIAQDIVGRKIVKACVAMDRDYDAHMGWLIKSRNVIYTWGYSWENDLLRANVVESIFYEIGHVDRNVVKVRTVIRNLIKTARSDLRWLTYADALLFAAGGALFNRGRAESAVAGGARAPHIRIHWLRGELRKRRLAVGKFHLVRRGVAFDPIRDCYGKVVGIFAYRILAYLLKKHTNEPDLSKHYGYIFLTRGVCDWLAASRGSSVSKYYFGKISRVVV